MSSSTRETRYDAIVIGSGMGGLAFSAIMSKLAGKRVLVLERHFKAGGFTHTFERPGGWEWDVGLHYVGGMREGTMGRALFDFVTDGGVEWNEMPEAYDQLHYPGFDFSFRKGRANFEADLIERFPAEREAIERYVRDLVAATGWVTRTFVANSMPAAIAGVVRWWNRMTSGLALTTTADYLDRNFREPQLKALLASQWGDYGLPPSKSAFGIHALIATHYFDGAFYPEGGSGTIAGHASRMIRAAGGEVLVNHEVTRIVVENGRAVGVEVLHHKGKSGERLRIDAPVIVSNAGAATTFRKLLAPEVEVPFRRELDELMQSTASCATLYLGFKRDPGELGFKGENHWLYDTIDHEEVLSKAGDLLEGKAHFVYLSFPSLKDSSALKHTAEIIAPFPYEAVAEFRDQPWRRRGAEYERIKRTIADGMLAAVEKRYPGFTDLVEYQEVSTPISIEHFTAHPGGGYYGVPSTPERFHQNWLTPRTHIPGLLLTGTDAGSLGIMGAFMGGVATASQLLGPLGVFRIVAAAKQAAARRRTAHEKVTDPIRPALPTMPQSPR